MERTALLLVAPPQQLPPAAKHVVRRLEGPRPVHRGAESVKPLVGSGQIRRHRPGRELKQIPAVHVHEEHGFQQIFPRQKPLRGGIRTDYLMWHTRSNGRG